MIIGRLTKDELEPALAALDDALDRSPDDLALGTLKLQVLNALDRPDEVEALLVDLYDRFPENADIAGDLVTWYRQRDDLPAVEALLRDRAGPLDGPTDDHIALIRFVAQTRGPEAAREEIAALIAANADTPETVDTYVRADAALAFDAGERDAAADMLRARLEDEAETAQTTSIKTMLARILLASGDQVGARALVEEALVAEAGNVDALKMQAEWLIEADKTTEAITGLRTALDQAPNDADILTLMARAHERAGSPQLAGERLSLAVEMSGSGPAESLRYAQFLLDQDRVRVARTVIDDAVAANPGDVTLLTEQARLALTDDDTAAAEAAIAALERIDGPDAADRATALRAALLLGQQRFDEGIALLEARAMGDETELRRARRGAHPPARGPGRGGARVPAPAARGASRRSHPALRQCRPADGERGNGDRRGGAARPDRGIPRGRGPRAAAARPAAEPGSHRGSRGRPRRRPRRDARGLEPATAAGGPVRGARAISSRHSRSTDSSTNSTATT